MRAAVVLVVGWAATAYARDAHVTATTRTTVYIDAGTADGLAAGARWQATIGGRSVAVSVAAVATHDALLAIDGAAPAIGTVIALPPGLTPPTPAAPRPPPSAMPAWRDDPGVLDTIQLAAAHEQPKVERGAPTEVSGELSLSVFMGADATNSSTSWQDVALASQLAVQSGAWRYDHVLEAHLAGSPELFTAPLQHAQARFDVYLMRLAYAPAGASYAAAIGRLPGAPLVELGTVDGAQARYAIDPRLDVTAFAGLRPASDLGISSAPRVGADVGWHVATADGLHARVDLGTAIDEYQGALDRALTAASATVSTPTLLAHADAAIDLATDAEGKSGARVSRVSGLVRAKRGRLTASVQAGFDRAFYDRALAAEAPGLLLGPRSFAAADASYAVRSGFELGGTVQGSRGDGLTSGYADVLARWWAPDRSWYVTAAPHVILGSLADELGVRGNLDLPLGAWALGFGGSVDRVYAGQNAWAGLGRISGSRAFLRRWRTSLSLEVAAGDGPARVFVFGLLGYRLGN